MQKIVRTQLIALLLGLITLALYWPVTRFEFINLDDGEYVFDNPNVTHGVTTKALVWALTAIHASNWHPLTWVSHMLDCNLYGLGAGDHHLTNLLFHTANVVLLFLLLQKLTAATWRSAFVAALFAWHPLHVQSVAWVSERKDVLSTFFFILTIWAYARYVRTTGPQDHGPQDQGPEHRTPNDVPRTQVRSSMFNVQSSRFALPLVWYVLALAFFSLGLMSKPMVVTLPFLLLLLDYWPLARFTLSRSDAPTLQRSLLEKLPFFVLSALECIATVWAQKAHAIASLQTLPVPNRIANALVSYVLYLWKTVWPKNLAVLYPYSHEATFWQASGAAALLLAITIAVVWQARARPYLAIGWFWFLGTLVPVIGLVQVGIQAMADRYTYIPLIGIFIMAAWGASALPIFNSQFSILNFQSAGQPVLAAVSIAIAAALIICTHLQLPYWQNTVALFTHQLETTGPSILGEYNLGQAYDSRGDREHAMIHYQKALAIQPNRLEAWLNYQSGAHCNLGLIYATLKKWPEAEIEFRAAVRMRPDAFQLHSDLGDCLTAREQFDEAITEYRIAVRMQPDSYIVWRRLGVALAKEGKAEEALHAYREAVRFNPDGALELNELAWFLATDSHAELRNGPEAVRLAQRACELTAGSEPRCLGTLDAALAEAGRLEEAITAAEMAREAALNKGEIEVANAAGERLELYRAGKPYRQK